MAHVAETSAFRPDIQGLRAVAVMLVVVYHSGLGVLSGGYIGVDVFFVISGYLITGLLCRELDRSNRVDLKAFYARRIRRLLPAASLVVVATVLIAWNLYGPLEFKTFSASAIATALYVSNGWFAHESTDYLAEGTDANPLLHTWSLSVEEQFYLIWPLLFVLAARSPAGAARTQRLWLLMVSLFVVSFVSAIWLTAHNQPWAFFGSPTRAWEFAAGGMIAMWPVRRPFAPRVAAIAGGLGLLLIAVASVQYDKNTVFPGWAAVMPVVGAVLVIAAAHHAQPVGVSRLLAARPMRYIGDISYSLYLWHWPVFVFMAFAVDQVGPMQSLFGILLSIGLAALTYVLVENPFRFGHATLRRAGVSLAFGVLVSVSTTSLAYTFRYIANDALQNDPQRRYLSAVEDVPKVYANGCHADFAQVETPECVFGDADADFTVVLFGDSHAAQWFPALESLAKKNRWRLVSLTKSACPSFLFEPYSGSPSATYEECTAWREQSFDRIGRIHPDVTIIASSSRYEIKGAETAAQEGRLMAEGIEKSLARLNGTTGQIIVMRDTPELDFNAPTCLSMANWKDRDADQSCALNPPDQIEDFIRQVDKRTIEKHDDIHLIDMTEAICPSGEACVVDDGGFVMYRDRSHLTASFSRKLADDLGDRLSAVLPPEMIE